MLHLAHALIAVLIDVLKLGLLCLRSNSSIRAENLVLRRQLAQLIERGIKPRRVDHATRVSLAVWSRLCDWRNTVVKVRPSLASIGMAHFLAIEEQGRATADPSGVAALNSQDGRRESLVGPGEDRQ